MPTTDDYALPYPDDNASLGAGVYAIQALAVAVDDRLVDKDTQNDAQNTRNAAAWFDVPLVPGGSQNAAAPPGITEVTFPGALATSGEFTQSGSTYTYAGSGPRPFVITASLSTHVAGGGVPELALYVGGTERAHAQAGDLDTGPHARWYSHTLTWVGMLFPGTTIYVEGTINGTLHHARIGAVSTGPL